jgi:hypothetical protein
LHCAGAAASAAPEAAANKATEAIRADRMRFMVLLLVVLAGDLVRSMAEE